VTRDVFPGSAAMLLSAKPIATFATFVGTPTTFVGTPKALLLLDNLQ